MMQEGEQKRGDARSAGIVDTGTWRANQWQCIKKGCPSTSTHRASRPPQTARLPWAPSIPGWINNRWSRWISACDKGDCKAWKFSLPSVLSSQIRYQIVKSEQIKSLGVPQKITTLMWSGHDPGLYVSTEDMAFFRAIGARRMWRTWRMWSKWAW